MEISRQIRQKWLHLKVYNDTSATNIDTFSLCSCDIEFIKLPHIEQGTQTFSLWQSSPTNSNSKTRQKDGQTKTSKDLNTHSNQKK